MSDQPWQGHAYPRDLALLVRQRWAEIDIGQGALPDVTVLDRLLSVSYQASLLHEEGRPITFRLAFAEPEAFTAVGGPLAGVHRLLLSPFRQFDARELQGFAPATAFHRSLIGVHREVDHELRMWGLVHSGPLWLQAVRGGRQIEQAMPPVLTVSVTGPGRVLVSHGKIPLAALAGGTLVDAATDVFTAAWLASLFEDLHAAQWATFEAELERTPGSHAPLDPALGRQLHLHVLRRIVATIRAARHGGTLIFLSAPTVREQLATGRALGLKYRFRDEEPRRRIFSLTVQIMIELARRQVRSADAVAPAGWAQYEVTTDPRLGALDDALFEVAHLVAMLANVDGAVVMTDQLEVLGFGAEISGALPEVASVDRSLDLEGTRSIAEDTDRVGTRHRSAYRLCQHLEDALVIVVSQDGGVRFVRQREGRVTYFDQIATGPWEV